MIKLRVLKRFTDKNTSELYLEDMIIEVNAKRGAELLAHPLELVEEIKEEKSESSKSAEEVMANVEVKKTSKKSKKVVQDN